MWNGIVAATNGVSREQKVADLNRADHRVKAAVNAVAGPTGKSEHLALQPHPASPSISSPPHVLPYCGKLHSTQRWDQAVFQTSCCATAPVQADRDRRIRLAQCRYNLRNADHPARSNTTSVLRNFVNRAEASAWHSHRRGNRSAWKFFEGVVRPFIGAF